MNKFLQTDSPEAMVLQQADATLSSTKFISQFLSFIVTFVFLRALLLGSGGSYLLAFDPLDSFTTSLFLFLDAVLLISLPFSIFKGWSCFTAIKKTNPGSAKLFSGLIWSWFALSLATFCIAAFVIFSLLPERKDLFFILGAPSYALAYFRLIYFSWARPQFAKKHGVNPLCPFPTKATSDSSTLAALSPTTPPGKIAVEYANNTINSKSITTAVSSVCAILALVAMTIKTDSENMLGSALAFIFNLTSYSLVIAGIISLTIITNRVASQLKASNTQASKLYSKLIFNSLLTSLAAITGIVVLVVLPCFINKASISSLNFGFVFLICSPGFFFLAHRLIFSIWVKPQFEKSLTQTLS